MSEQTKKEYADKIRLDILTLSDEDLINFKAAIWGGEGFEWKSLESVSDHVKRVAKAHLESLPF